MKCNNCGIEFEAKRKDAKFCSKNCKLQAFRKASVETDNVTLKSIPETDNFKFYTIQKAREPINDQAKEDDVKSEIREAKYWYDVPLGAIPVKQKGWPDKPDYMNGRQYFLWWKNEFEEGDSGPVILNPFPVYDKVTYDKAGEGSRKWGTV